MNNTSTTLLVTGVVTGVATIYAYKNGFTVDKVITMLEEKNEKFGEIVRNLYNMSYDLLLKIYNYIKKFIEEKIFLFKVKYDDFKFAIK